MDTFEIAEVAMMPPQGRTSDHLSTRLEQTRGAKDVEG
jgi:hypothetical protein